MPTEPPLPAVSPLSTRAQREFEGECIRLFGEAVELLGVPRSVGQIYGLHFASPQPLCFSDVVERLEISKGSASQGLQLLRSIGAIKLLSGTGRQSGERNLGAARDYYEPELSLRKLMNGVLQERVRPLSVSGKARLDRLRETAGRADNGNGFYVDRAKQLATWHRRLRAALPVLGVLFGPRIRK